MMNSPHGEYAGAAPPVSAAVVVSAAACRLPGGLRTVDQLGEFLRAGTTAVVDVPATRWGPEFHDPTGLRAGTTSSHRGSFLDDVAGFDAEFFGISDAEAAAMDPQQRLVLEVGWEAMRGVRPRRDQWAGSRTATYVGLLSADYRTMLASGPGQGGIDGHYATGVEASFAAGRLGYLFDLRGPAMTVSTACSSSLVALSLAADALSAGRIDAAVVCGVSLLLCPELSIYMSRIGALSLSGECRPFSGEADGVVRGEGAAALVLERVEDVRRDGRRPLAVVRAHGTNHDGYSAGLTAPNADAQAELIRDVLAHGGLEADDVDYVEAHATGTEIGDAVEVAGLSAALGTGRKTGRLLVGSHKANFGHLDSAAGMVGLLKAIGVLRSGVVPPQPFLTEDAEPGPGLRVPAVPTRLDRRRPLRVGVSAFGLSGTNAHVLLEAPAEVPDPGGPADPGLVLLSSPTARAMDARTAAWASPGGAGGSALADDPHAARASLFAEHRPHRAAAVGRAGERGALLRSSGKDTPGVLLSGHAPDRRDVVLALPGELSAWDRSAVMALLRDPTASAARERCRSAFPAGARAALDRALETGGSAAARPREVFSALFTAQYALACRLRADGLRPVAVLGEGLGELTSAAVAGSCSLAEAVAALLRHAEEIESGGAGRTLVVHASAEWVAGSTEVAASVRVVADRGPLGVVVSGPADAVHLLERRCRAYGVVVGSVDPDYALWPAKVPGGEPPGGNGSLHGRFRAAIAASGRLAIVELGGSGELAALGRALLADAGRTDPIHRLAAAHGGGRSTPGAAGGPDEYALALAQLWIEGVDLGRVPPGESYVPPPDRQPPWVWDHRPHWSAALTGAAAARRAPVADLPPAPAVAPSPPADAQQDLRALVEAEVRRELRAGADAALAPDVGLFEQGLTSLGAVELRRRLGKRVGAVLATTVLFEYPTLDQLVEHLGAVTLAEPAEPAAHEPAAPQPQGSSALAVVGMAHRLPGRPDDAGLWAMIRDGECTSRELPNDRPAAHTWRRGDATIPRGAGFMDGVDEFDHRFFRMSPAEARAVDPQQRILLEVAWEAMEDAGISVASARQSRTGAYVGLDSADYAQLSAADPAEVGPYFGTGTSPAATASRLSYALGLTGPAVAVDSACSSSLVALHVAGAALREGDCDAALVGAANLVLTPAISAAMSRAGALAADGRCKPFSQDADGYGRADGVVCLVVKTLARARADRDRIHLVVEAGAVNHEGAGGGFTVPSTVGQADVIRRALDRAGRRPCDVVAVEAHGTGTALGDPIELRALSAVFAGDRREPLLVGSVKSTLGHLEAAAGLAGLVKLALCYRNGCYPAQPLAGGRTRAFDWDDSPLLPSPGGRLAPTDLVGISSFGFSGTNAHYLLAGPVPTQQPAAPGAWLLPVSGHTAETTASRVRDLARAAVSWTVEDLAGAVSTAATGRTHLAYRACFTAPDAERLLAALRKAAAPGGELPEIARATGTAPAGSAPEAGTDPAELGRAFLAGHDLDWATIGGPRRTVPLPAYPWQHARHWGVTDPVPAELPAPRQPDEVPKPAPRPKSRPTAATRREALRASVAEVAAALGMTPGEIDPAGGFFDLGMDSIHAVTVTKALGERFGVEVEATATFEHFTCQALADHLLDLVSGRAEGTSSAGAAPPDPVAPPAPNGRPDPAGPSDAAAELARAMDETKALLSMGADG
jgi:acyl transferase domain-containing protein